MPRQGTIVRLSELHLIVLFLAVALFSFNSYAACTEGEFSGSFNGEFCFADNHGFCGFPSSGGCITSGYYAGKCLCSNYQIDEICPSSAYNGGYLSVPFRIARQINNCPNINQKTECYYRYRCDTQEEADSLARPPVDSVTYCKNVFWGDPLADPPQPMQQYMELYRCPGNFTDFDECRPLMQVPGTCSQNGYEPGPQPSDSLNKDVQCFATFNGDCYMMDKASGNTFTCPCDNNSCSNALLQVASGECINPYASSSSLASSSSSSITVSSSSSIIGSSSSEYVPVSSPAVDSSGDWEYDYNAILNAINGNIINSNNNTQSNFLDLKSQLFAWEQAQDERLAQQLAEQRMIRANTQQIASNTDYTNTLIKTENAKLIQKYNDLIDELRPIGDYVETISNEITQSVSSVDWPEWPDLDTISLDTSISDSLLSAHRSSLDSLFNTIDSLQNDTLHNYIALDSIYNFADSSDIRSKFSRMFFHSSGTASNSCPVWNPDIGALPVVGELNWKIDFGDLFGKFDICALARWLVRLATAIAIIFGTFKAVLSAFGSRD